MSPQRKYMVLGAVGGFLFCLGAAMLVRSCEIAQMRATVGAFAWLLPADRESAVTLHRNLDLIRSDYATRQRDVRVHDDGRAHHALHLGR